MLIYNALIINEGRCYRGWLSTIGDKIDGIGEGCPSDVLLQSHQETIDAEGLWLLPGVIDTHVHFREPGLTHKADIYHESRAAVAGGVTSFMDMPNTKPQTTTVEAWEAKCRMAERSSVANYSFYIGAANDNIHEIHKADMRRLCGVKLFMGSSTGNMLVDDCFALERLFAEAPVLIAAHCEDERIIRANMEAFTARYGDAIPFSAHPLIRSREACYKSSARAIELAEKYGSQLHILHISTAEELTLLSERHWSEKRITAETCPHYLRYASEDYDRLGSRIKCNPAIKEIADRDVLRQAMSNGRRIDTVGTDHAPHLLAEKQGGYKQAVSGFPSIQHTLPIMLGLAAEGYFSAEDVVDKMCHAPADIYHIDRRGYLREGWYADLVLIDPDVDERICQEDLRYKCGWTPLMGEPLHYAVRRTVVNGQTVYQDGDITALNAAMALTFLH